MIRSHHTIVRGLRTAGAALIVYSATLLPAEAQTVSANAQTVSANAQTVPAKSAEVQRIDSVERRISDLTETLIKTQAALQQSLAELSQLRAEIGILRQTNGTAQPVTTTPTLADPQALQEQLDIQQAEIKQHEQTKVESASKYNLTVTGLVLVNAFSNAGVVDNAELPTLALSRNYGSSHGSVGMTLRQTVLGVAARGPEIAGAQSFAWVNADFLGGATTNSFGYTALSGYVRMRDSNLGLAWNRSKLQIGYTGPLISPLSPTSYAQVAEPALSSSGNLWSWSPQVQFQQIIPTGDQHGVSLEGGLIYPQTPSYNSVQLDSPVEASRRPGVEGRVSYHANTSATAPSRSLAFGVGAYTANQFYNSATRIHAWAVTGDWQVPLSKWAEVSGEIYRGRSLGGLGGGIYKDILSGTDPLTGVFRSVGVETAGGWSQLKLNFSRWVEVNAMFGLDDAFASSFRSVILPTGSNALTTSARNSTVTGNLIFRPRQSILLSPEYRHLETWRYTGTPFVANIFTLSAGYQF